LVPLWMRPLVAADALSFYLVKTVIPAGLSADYGRAPDVARAAGWLWWTWLAPAVLAGVLVAVRPWRVFLLPLAVFAAALLPTLGLVPFNFQVVSTVADRYAYFALLGPALALAMVVARLARTPVTAAAAVVVGLAAFLSVQRLPLWSEDLRLFSAVLEVNPRSWKAMHNYASALDDRGRSAEAEPLLRKVIALRPDSAEAHNDLAVILWNLNRRGEAVLVMRRAINLRPTPGSARNLLQMEATQGHRAGVIEALQVIVTLEPDNSEAAAQLRRLQEELPR
jgi:tetratricopeptide (TPR) repeat protein